MEVFGYLRVGEAGHSIQYERDRDSWRKGEREREEESGNRQSEGSEGHQTA